MRKRIVIIFILAWVVVLNAQQNRNEQSTRQSGRVQMQQSNDYISGLNQNQLNEINVYLNQARIHEARNQITQALEILEELYKRYPSQENVVEAYLRVLYLSSDYVTPKTILESKKSGLTDYFITKQEINYLIKISEVSQAEKKTFDWLNKNSGIMQHYRELATIFESAGLFDTAIKIYLQIRSLAKDQNLHSLELSNAYYYIKNVDKFFEESLKFLRLNSGYLYYFRSRFTEFIIEDKQNIKKLDKLIKENEPEAILEIYAFSLVEAKELNRATQVFEKLPLAKMTQFADDLQSNEHFDYALQVFQKALLKVDTPATLVDIQMKCARIYFQQNKINDCIEILNLIINNDEAKRSPHNFRTRANKESRLMMALINIQENRSVDDVKKWFEAATNFTNNHIERSEILYSLARYLYLKEDYDQANSVIISAISGHDSSTSIYKQSAFYRYELAMFQNNPARDSLLTECIIHFPEDERISDLLFLETFITNLKDGTLSRFLMALRYKGLYQNQQAINTLYTLSESSQLDELYLLVYEWALQCEGNEKIISKIEKINFQNPVLKDYIFLHSIRKSRNLSEQKNNISNFLNNQPRNFISPQLRYLMFSS